MRVQRRDRTCHIASGLGPTGVGVLNKKESPEEVRSGFGQETSTMMN